MRGFIKISANNYCITISQVFLCLGDKQTNCVVPLRSDIDFENFLGHV